MKLFNLRTSLNSVVGPRVRAAIREMGAASVEPLANCALTTGGLAIKAGGSGVVKTASAVQALINGNLLTKAAGDMAALSGTVVNATFNVFVFSLTTAGTAVTRMGIAGASLATARFPPVPSDEVVIGFVKIGPTGTGDFVGGTTALDDGTVVPVAVYVNTPFPFNPLIKVN